MLVSSSGCTWCVCKEMSETALQKTLDYACGAGADCTPIHQNSACYHLSAKHCESPLLICCQQLFSKEGQAAGTCDFAGTATISLTDPSYSGCSWLHMEMELYLLGGCYKNLRGSCICSCFDFNDHDHYKQHL